MVKSFYANGKLLLTGEYFVLDGALALAVPTRYGQGMTIELGKVEQDYFTWKSQDVDQHIWFNGNFSKKDFSCLNSTDNGVARRLTEIFQTIRLLQPDFFTTTEHLLIMAMTTHLEFPRDWGLGTSSTLIAMLAEWADVDAYVLLSKTFGGSGYDLACAKATSPLLYQLPGPVVQTVGFHPPFIDHLYFVYLNQKQNSREGIARYRQAGKKVIEKIQGISEITQAILTVDDQRAFDGLLRIHEEIVSTTLDIPKVQSLYFSDFNGTIKSLGAWGGDFVLASSNMERSATEQYFKSKGMDVVLGFRAMCGMEELKQPHQ